ncbi:hypothetical protein KIN20_032089, partial [Parelaphostrongylus tenuis]
ADHADFGVAQAIVKSVANQLMAYGGSEPNAQELSPVEAQIHRHQSTEYSKALVRPIRLDLERSQS